MYVTNHTDYSSPVLVAKAQTLSDRILLIPKDARHGLVDDHNKGTVLVIPDFETPPMVHGNPNCFEVARTHRPVTRNVEHAGRLCRTPFDIERPGIIRAAEGKISCESGRLYAGNTAQAFKQLMLED